MRRRWALLAAIVAVGPLALLAAGCGGTSSAKGASGDKPLSGKTIGFSVPIQANVTLSALGDGLAAEIEREGGTVKILDARGNPDKQLTDLRQLISEGVDAIVVAPLAWESVQGALRQAQVKKIPVLVHDAVLDNPTKQNLTPATFQVNEPRAQEAKQAAQLLTAGSHGAAGTIAMSFCPNGPPFMKMMKEISAAVPADGGKLLTTVCNPTDDANGAYTVAQRALTRFPNAGGVFAYNDSSAIGVAKAANRLGRRGRLVITGINAEPQGIAAVKSGEIDATFDYNPVEIGQTLGRATEMVLTGKGDQLPASVEAQTTEYTKKNADKFVPWSQRVNEVKQGKYLGVPLGK